MKSKMSQIGVGLAALSALAAEGKDFDRAELNAMLDKLAASPEPKVHRGPQATCYKMAMPQPERFEYVCKKCGTHTVYPENVNRMANTLARYRDDVAKLKALGLDIALDESVLCQKCSPTQDFCWINAKYISETGELLGDNVNLRVEPKLESQVLGSVRKYRGPLKRLPAQQGDSKEWVRVESPFKADSIYKLAWVINGTKTTVQSYDAKILNAFLTGQDKWTRDFGEEVSVKGALPRLRELLGELKK
jgi:hypothetical protein